MPTKLGVDTVRNTPFHRAPMLAVMLPALLPSQAWAADCHDKCQPAIYCRSLGIEPASEGCSRVLPICHAMCDNEKPKLYRSVAFDENSGKHFVTPDNSSADIARQDAMTLCGNASPAAKCKLLVLIENGCGALVSAAGEKKPYVDSASTKEAAEAGAKDACKFFGGSQCRLETVYCTGAAAKQ